MRSVKSRNWSNEQDEKLTSIMNELEKNQKKMKWNDIADLMKFEIKDCNKNGKQCRQRWTNQLNPQVKRTEEWSKQQNEIMFDLHSKLGNKWAEIAGKLPGRTDNCVKNHFYSVMRGGLRKINTYIENVKRKQILVKTFKNEILNKILVICQGKSNEKFQLTDKAKQLAHRIKQNLTVVSLNDAQNLQLKENVYNQICQFARNCRKKKTKKMQESSYSQSSSQQQQRGIKDQIIKQTVRSHTNNNEQIKNQNEYFISTTVQKEKKNAQQIPMGMEDGQIKVEKNKEEIFNNFVTLEVPFLNTMIQNERGLEKTVSLSNNLDRSSSHHNLQRSSSHGYNLSRTSSNGQNLLSNFSGEFPFNVPKSNGIFNMDSLSVEGSDHWAKNSGNVQIVNERGSFLYTVPEVKRKSQSENKRGAGEVNFMDHFVITAQLLPIFYNGQPNQGLTNSQAIKSYDFDRSSSNFSGSMKERSTPFEANSTDYAKMGIDFNLQALLSSSSFPSHTPLPMTLQSNSSLFSAQNSFFGKQSQQYKNKTSTITTTSTSTATTSSTIINPNPNQCGKLQMNQSCNFQK